MQSQLGYQLYGFLGHAGWTEGQLEAELEQGAWLLSPLTREMDTLEEAVWRAVLSRESPEMRMLADEPDDPSVN